jgi:hypothetical protein
MKHIKGDRFYVALNASQARRRLKGHGLGVRKVESAGTNRAMIIHTATGEHLQQLLALFQNLITGPEDPPAPAERSDNAHE